LKAVILWAISHLPLPSFLTIFVSKEKNYNQCTELLNLLRKSNPYELVEINIGKRNMDVIPRGHWTEEERQRLISLRINGLRQNWTDIAKKYFPGRSGSAVRNFWRRNIGMPQSHNKMIDTIEKEEKPETRPQKRKREEKQRQGAEENSLNSRFRDLRITDFFQFCTNRGLTDTDYGGFGNCLFNSFSGIIRSIKPTEQEIIRYHARSIRGMVCDWLQQHQDTRVRIEHVDQPVRLADIMVGEHLQYQNNLILRRANSVHDYITNMRRDGMYAGTPILHALANLFNVRIRVVSVNREDQIIDEQIYDPLGGAILREICLKWKNGHYTALV
jgi:hypothetical protein